MALEQKELVQTSAANVFAVYPQVSMNDQITGIFGTSAGAEELDYCTPVGYNESTGYYGAWVAPDPTVLVVTLTSAASGNWTVTANGVTTANIAYNATAAAVVEAIRLIGHDVTVSKEEAVYTITFGDEADITTLPTVSGTVSGITGGSPTAVATAGTATYGLHNIRGFVWPETVQLSATKQVQGQIMVSGRIPLRYITDTVDAGDVAALTAELKANALDRGLIIEDLVNAH